MLKTPRDAVSDGLQLLLGTEDGGSVGHDELLYQADGYYGQAHAEYFLLDH